MLINKLDNVEVNLEDGHKYALRDIVKGENVIKYGNPIGHATADIKAGEHVHTHNVATNRSDHLTYPYAENTAVFPIAPTGRTFMGYQRENGEVGVRNEVWIITSVVSSIYSPSHAPSITGSPIRGSVSSPGTTSSPISVNTSSPWEKVT